MVDLLIFLASEERLPLPTLAGGEAGKLTVKGLTINYGFTRVDPLALRRAVDRVWRKRLYLESSQSF